MAERLYSIPEVAELLSVHRVTVYRLIEAGELAAVRLSTRSRQMRVTESELSRYQSALVAA